MLAFPYSGYLRLNEINDLSRLRPWVSDGEDPPLIVVHDDDYFIDAGKELVSVNPLLDVCDVLRPDFVLSDMVKRVVRHDLDHGEHDEPRFIQPWKALVEERTPLGELCDDHASRPVLDVSHEERHQMLREPRFSLHGYKISVR